MVLAIDPGVTTGVALLNQAGEVILANELRGDPSTVAKVLAEIPAEDVVIEQGPIGYGRSSAYLEELDFRLKEVFPNATWLRPVEWKGTPRAQTPVNEKSVHVKDAVRMGREHIHCLNRAQG